ncbi:SRPBCC family protein [Nocardiopsis trehalosi]|jgi:aromatase|uniref:SRPBCC family protein n=1 Tax=Nocardiopsis trehalosi TaxID=109329 RepID=UPI00082F2BC7|nr:SRPBCC family protein [Nocardiopsis trehalosi]
MAESFEHAIVIDAPMGLIWDMTNDVESWPDLFLGYADVEILERRGATTVVRLTREPLPDGTVQQWTSERTADPVARTVRTRRLDPAPYMFFHLLWTYRAMPSGVELRCRAEYAFPPGATAADVAATAAIDRRGHQQMFVLRDRIEARARSAAAAAERP